MREERLSLRPGVFLATDPDRLMLLRREPWHRSDMFGAPTASKRAMLTKLADGPCSVADLEAATTAADGDAAAFTEALQAGGWLVTTVRYDGRDLYSMQPMDVAGRPPECEFPARNLTLCRFAVLRREGGEVVVESPLARARMLVHSAAVAAMVAELAQGEIGAAGVPSAVRDALLADLSRAGLAVPRSRDDAPAARLWSPPDLLLHGRSRMGTGGYAGGFGRTGWAAPFVEPPVADREGWTDTVLALNRPDLAALGRSDPPLAAVLEERRSIRTHDDENPMTVNQLSELLYRCAAHRSRAEDGFPERTGRPYPSGGGMYELELYPVVRHVDGLAPGMYHYDPRLHQLRLVCGSGPAVDRLLQGAMWSSMMSARPQALIVLAARFGRLTSMYEQLAYSLILKHVGVLYQTMYLVATAMGLAPCGLGAGDAVAFSDATGLEYTVESSVGEFMLGSRTPQ
ncbi:SagB family peptide dehydrogenase [Dactylosporangium sp. NPDC051541]|uniref:SagB family peptide dehydrogenase n=1 Tax=Dactylosporangium sp. NPDC051541 TaxID=3363977 RepID=UPI0037BD8968